MSLEGLIALCLVSVLLVVSTELILIASRGISFHWLGPFEVWLGLDLIKELVDRFPKNCVHHLIGFRRWFKALLLLRGRSL